jgi:hypothetical protein
MMIRLIEKLFLYTNYFELLEIFIFKWDFNILYKILSNKREILILIKQLRENFFFIKWNLTIKSLKN